MCRNIFLVSLFLISLNVFTQPKKSKTNNFWGTMGAQLFTKDSSMFFLENNYRFSNFNNSFSETGIGENLYRVHIHGGFEYAATKHWRPGFSLKYAKYPIGHDVYFRPNIQHWGNIKGLRFIKDLAFEWIAKSESPNPNIVVRDETRWSMRIALEKDFWWLNNRLFRFGTFYRLFILSKVGEDKEVNNSYPATFDKTRLQLYADIEVLKRAFLKLYYMKETDYFFTMDDTGFNVIKHIFGLELKYVLY